MFDILAQKIQDTLRFLRNRGKLSEKDVDEALHQIKLSLLEADVNYKVVKDFINKVKEKATGREVLRSLTPGQMVVKIVHEELTCLMGEKAEKINFASKPPTVIMMVGLQGSGKTTASGKLAKHLKNQGRRPLLVAADVYRPAAIEQLHILGGKIEIPVFSLPQGRPEEIASSSLKEADKKGNDVIIIDTAGRLHIDEDLMMELKRIAETVKPAEVILVADAMTGQDAVKVAQGFMNYLDITSVILTKMDSDARGGAALSLRAVTGRPIKYIGTGEKLDAFEPFHPERMSSRILGMGDILTLIEKAEASVDAAQSKKMMEKLQKADFTLADFLVQLQQMKKLGPVEDIFKMLPGLPGKELAKIRISDKDFTRLEAIINSMTAQERLNPQIINGSRKIRIAKGSGTTVQEVNKLLNQFEQSRKMLKQFAGMAKTGKKGIFPF